MPWRDAREMLRDAEIFWLSTVRSDDRPHVTSPVAIGLDEALHFCTRPAERKARNLALNPRCAITTGCNSFGSGFDLVIEGDAERVREDDSLRRLADQFTEKSGWEFSVREGGFFTEEGGDALVFRVSPRTVFGFGKGEPFSQTRWQFT